MSERILTPRIYIGAGGSGRRMVALLKQRLHAELDLSDAKRGSFQFLALDCDEYQEADCNPLDPFTEFLHIGSFDPKLAIEAQYMRKAVSEWWYDSYLPPYIQQGAGAIRLIGRLCFFYHYRRIQAAVQGAITRATKFAAAQQMGEEVAIYIIGSLAGGTGSSMMLDLALLAREACRYRQVYVNGVIMLPDVFTVAHSTTQWKFKERWMANGYAAFKELVHFNENPEKFRPLYRDGDQRKRPAHAQRLYDKCFFIEPVLGTTSTVGRDGEIFDLAAEALYLFSASGHGSKAGSTLVNTDGIYYASIGTQAIEFPIKHVQDYARHHLTERCLKGIAPTEELDFQDKAAACSELDDDLEARKWKDLGASAIAWCSAARPGAIAPATVQSGVKLVIDSLDPRMEQFKRAAAAALLDQVKTERMKWEDRMQKALQDDMSLDWCLAYLEGLQEHIIATRKRLDDEVKREQLQHEHAKSALQRGGGRFSINPFRDRKLQEQEIAGELNTLYTQSIPNRMAKEAMAEALAHFTTEWLTPTLNRIKSLRDWIRTSAIADERRRVAEVQKALALYAHKTPSTALSLPPDRLGELVESLTRAYRFGHQPLQLLWNWTGPDRQVLLHKLEESIVTTAKNVVNLDMLSAWRTLEPREERLRESFLKAAESCRPFWSYVKEYGEEYMTELSIVSMPQGPTWSAWFEQLGRPLQQIPGDEYRVVFLSVEGAQKMEMVHLKEMPEWFRMYEQVRRAYDQGDESRPLHIHRDWEADVEEIDPSTPGSVAFLFGPAEAFDLIKWLDGQWVFQVTGKQVPLGRDDRSAVISLMDLDEESERALREAVAPEALITQQGPQEVVRILERYISRGVEAKGLVRARARQAEALLRRVRGLLTNGEGSATDGAKTNDPSGPRTISNRSAAAFQAPGDLAVRTDQADDAGTPAGRRTAFPEGSEGATGTPPSGE